MDEREPLARRFGAHRARTRAIAFRLLGSATEADDAVQETWLRVSPAGTAGVENLGGWLTTAVSRACLSLLEARQSRREEPLICTLLSRSCGGRSDSPGWSASAAPESGATGAAGRA